MKELSIEEKAKAYDKAIEVAKRKLCFDNAGMIDNFTPDDIREIFPELKESEDEDEKIRKVLLKMIYDTPNFVCEDICNIPKEKCIAWLEKQGKKTIWHNEDEEPQRGSLILLIMQSGTPIVAKIIEPNHTFNHGERWAYIDDLLEKQGEKPQGKSALEAIKEEKVDNANKVEPKDYYSIDPHFGKPVDKVEPFHEGDWVVQDNVGIYKVIEVCKSWYEVVDDKGKHYSIGFDKEYMCHLWSIDDAKDGDVLVSRSPFIYGKQCPYGGLNWYDNKFIKASNFIFTDSPVHPATKEQSDTLFTKMKEAGYEWDAKKKELNKIEQKSALKIEPLKAEHGKYYYCIKDYFYGGKRFASKGDVIQALRGLPIMSLKDASEYFLPVNSIECDSTWNEEDENEVAILEAYIRSNEWSESHIDRALGIVDELVNKCKSFKDRVQPKQEWSEEDEVGLGDAMWAIEQAKTIAKNENDMGNLWYAETWLKSLKDKYTWKPSEKQMEALQYVYRNCNPPLSDKLGWDSIKTIELMYQELKKLRGE